MFPRPSLRMTQPEDILNTRWETIPMKVTEKRGEDIMLVHDTPHRRQDGWPLICKIRGRVDSVGLNCDVDGDYLEESRREDGCYSFLLGPSNTPNRRKQFDRFMRALSPLKHHKGYNASLSSFKKYVEDMERLYFFVPMTDFFGNPTTLFVYDRTGILIPRKNIQQSISGVDVDVTFLLLLDTAINRPNAVFSILHRVQIVD
ncbi:hypothetical protein BDN72DRAFT_860486 [Pluteus cervinus]|uniref:Uncharacterized protein n=1 Tax=Pluteus cervinus TaxID=181527 RepID=A0ACD3AJ11_9AGAR|nr:hypothetical protein BDN72DRAFT_860486 [Pluteus cervinus]